MYKQIKNFCLKYSKNPIYQTIFNLGYYDFKTILLDLQTDLQHNFLLIGDVVRDGANVSLSTNNLNVL